MLNKLNLYYKIITLLIKYLKLIIINIWSYKERKIDFLNGDFLNSQGSGA